MKILILEGLHGNNKGKKMQWRLKRTNLKVGNTVVLNCHDWKIVKVIKEKKKSFFPEGTTFSEYSTGFISNSFYEAIEKMTKEVKKVKPYFELKVVKVKKKKTYSNHIMIDGKKYILYEDKKENVYPHKEKGNWVNGEDLDSIKFPCFCSYFDCGDKRKYGEIDIVFFNGNKRFRLRESRQLTIEKVIYCVYHRDTLKSLIEDYKIHILKGKIIIFEEK